MNSRSAFNDRLGGQLRLIQTAGKIRLPLSIKIFATRMSVVARNADRSKLRKSPLAPVRGAVEIYPWLARPPSAAQPLRLVHR